MRSAGSGVPALAVALALTAAAPASRADELRVAVAASCADALDEIARAFAEETGYRVVAVTGSTGKLAAQIEQGAPLDVFLAADRESPARLERTGHAVAGSRVPYASGRLVLWSARPAYVDSRGEVLARGGFRSLALANPETAPYGRAARQTLERLGLWTRLEPRLVRGESVAQAWHFIASGAAELGFVALAALERPGAAAGGSRWLVPAELHEPIVHEAVLLERARTNPAARAFLAFLVAERAQGILERHGYRRGGP